jgi:hypothetical protein
MSDAHDDITIRLCAKANDAECWSDSYVGQRQCIWLREFALAMRDAAFEIERLRKRKD